MTTSVTTSLNNKIAVVTGAGTGLGRQITHQLVAAGARVAALGRTTSTLEKLVDELGSQVLPITTDVSDPDQVRSAFDKIDSELGDTAILINNAAIYQPFTLDQASDEQLQKILGINVLGPAYCMREAIPRMKHLGSGDVINVSSESARNPFPYLTFYAASKSALETLSTGQRTELSQYDIRVSILRTGTMTGEDASVTVNTWAPGQLEKALAVWEKTGHATYAGTGMLPATVAASVIHALTLPREATMDLLEIRSSQ